MSYEVYKIMHLASLVLVAASVGVSFFGPKDMKLLKIAGMIGSLLLLVAGMGLLARMYPGEPWPGWALAKLGLWFLIVIASASLSKRLTAYRGLAFTGILVLLLGAIALAVFKPF